MSAELSEGDSQELTRRMIVLQVIWPYYCRVSGLEDAELEFLKRTSMKRIINDLFFLRRGKEAAELQVGLSAFQDVPAAPEAGISRQRRAGYFVRASYLADLVDGTKEIPWPEAVETLRSMGLMQTGSEAPEERERDDEESWGLDPRVVHRGPTTTVDGIGATDPLTFEDPTGEQRFGDHDATDGDLEA